jgi:hypothetical protein
MFKIIQTVHYDDGKHNERTWYATFKDFYKALEVCHELNCRNAEKNQCSNRIPVTYTVKYDPKLDPEAVA